MSIRMPIADLVVKSPIETIKQHISATLEATEALVPFLEAEFSKNWEQAASLHQAVVASEHRADELKAEFRKNMPKRLMMPVSRTDLLRLITSQDKIANCAKDIAGIIVGRRMRFPKPMRAGVLDFARTAVAAVRHAEDAVNQLDTYVKSGFGQHNLERVEAALARIDESERQTDTMQSDLRAQLFKLEDDLSPVEAMFLYEVLVWIGNIADNAEDVGNHVQSIALS
ncbi:MAG: TIGR00153 family protein [Halieaceae bacterium]|nr:TIGR00153 family protein [Halieaceae bacterium]